MQTKQIAATSEQQSTSNLVGTWRITLPKKDGFPEAFEALHTFFTDGNWTESNSVGEVNHGVWMGQGSNAMLTFEGYFFDEKRKHTGKFQVRSSINLASADHHTAQCEMDSIDLEGKV